ncbi:hypothetical protein GCM10011322_21410 [Salinarimonas ramus]|uniref:Uncharacterized protein n=1 Tax=Salinarimonas ramus TaxID=690164 RepID=A0A917V489_9HYPH|nr:hypothetical protein GCM10011322_21410 [Salinarimonas ramus]
MAILAVAVATPASAQAVSPDFDWGDDSSPFANDRECDDPRFVGPGMVGFSDEEHRGADATDCFLMFKRGRITLADGAGSDGAAAPRTVVGGIDYGDDTGRWANDGECDDPRFEGEGMAAVLVEEDRFKDASDCRRLVEAGSIALRAGESGGAPSRSAPAPAAAGDVDFGDDTGRWANDGECDDPRFEGEGMAAVLVEEDRLRDASDCRRLYEAGSIALRAGEGGAASAPATAVPTAPATPPPPVTPSGPVDFGDDTSRWANDGECDDPRFQGRGMAAVLLDEDAMRDASDCRRLYEEGAIDLVGRSRADVAPAAPAAPAAPPASSTAGIDFGDDSSRWANDGECDDPRFDGEGMAIAPQGEDTMRDATDCRNLLAEGRIELR